MVEEKTVSTRQQTCILEGAAYLVPLAYLLDIGAYFKTQSRVQAARRLVEKKNLGIRHETAGYTETFLLPAAEAFLHWRADDGMRLRLQSEAGNQIVDTVQRFGLGDVSVVAASATLTIVHLRAKPSDLISGFVDIR